MERKLSCLRCGQAMQFLRRENLQLGKTGWLTGDWGNLVAGALDVAILQCPGCGKLEFFRGDFAFKERTEEPLAQVTCPGAVSAMILTIPSARCAARKTPFFEEGTRPWAFLTN